MYVKKREIDNDKLIHMYNDDAATYAEICEEFDISLDTLRKRIKQYGLQPRRKPVCVDEKEFKEAYFAGLSRYQLAKKFRICRSTVARIVKQLKLREYEIHCFNSSSFSSKYSSISDSCSCGLNLTPK